MSGSKARRIRKIIYGDMATKSEYPKDYRRFPNGMIVSKDIRRKYQIAKRTW